MPNRNALATLVALACSGASAATADNLRLSGPFTHENLSVYLLHAGGRQSPGNVLTLREAMEQKKAAVYETGNVQELAIENLSDRPVFVQAGDIVKGGKQDRVLTTDLLLPPHSGRLPIASFCVEQGRWTKRGTEAADQFHAATASVPTRALKTAIREPGNQQKVWSEVAAARVMLASTGAGSASNTSMQLALEDKRVNDSVDLYVTALSKVVDSQPDAVGFVYTVNGKFSGADVYASPDLFRRMWPKLLHSSAAEALADRNKGNAPPPAADAIRKTLADAENGRAAAPQRNASSTVTKKESEGAMLYVTTHRQAGESWLHKSYIAK